MKSPCECGLHFLLSEQRGAVCDLGAMGRAARTSAFSPKSSDSHSRISTEGVTQVIWHYPVSSCVEWFELALVSSVDQPHCDHR
jgi:hypothetical protein